MRIILLLVALCLWTNVISGNIVMTQIITSVSFLFCYEHSLSNSFWLKIICIFWVVFQHVLSMVHFSSHSMEYCALYSFETSKSLIYCLYNLQHIEAEKAEDTSEDLDMEVVDTSDRMTCFVLFRKFIKEVNCLLWNNYFILLFIIICQIICYRFDWLSTLDLV